MVQRLGQLFGRKFQKVPYFAKKHEKSSIWPKVSTFSSKLPWSGVLFNFAAKGCKECLNSRGSMRKRLFCGNLQLLPANYHGSAFGSTFRQKVAKGASFHEEERKGKWSMSRKLSTSSSRLPWFGVWVNFSAKSCKNCPISGKSTKNRRFGQNLKLFRGKQACLRVMVNIWSESSKKCLISRESTTNRRLGQNLQLSRANYHDSAFGSTFRQKVAKTASFRKRARKTVDLAKTCSFSEQTTMIRRLGQLFARKLRKLPRFAREHEKPSIWRKLAAFPSKLPWFGVWVNFSPESCKKCLISRETTKNRLFGQSCKVLEQTTMVRGLGQLFGKKLEKVRDFAKRHEKSAIWPKLATFSSKLPWCGVWVNFSAESCKKCLISRKSTKNRLSGQKLQVSGANYHGSGFG